MLQKKIKSVIAALSVPEHWLSFYFVCDDQIQISCAVCLIALLPVTFSQLDPHLGVGWDKRFVLYEVPF